MRYIQNSFHIYVSYVYMYNVYMYIYRQLWSYIEKVKKRKNLLSRNLKDR